MKKHITFIIYLLSFISCSNNNSQKQENSSLEKNHFPQYILIVYMGEINHPVSPLLIVTDNQDTTYLKYMRENKENLENYGFIIPKIVKEEYLKKAIVDDNTFNIIRTYIEKNNTGINKNIWSSDDTTSKIILEGQHDSLVYVVDKSNIDYYSNLIQLIKPFNNKNLMEALQYYEELTHRRKSL